MEVSYECRQVITSAPVVDETSKQQSISDVYSWIEELRDNIKLLREEKKTLIEICAKFTAFLANNSVAPFNDALDDYFALFIREAETVNVKLSDNSKTLARLQHLRQKYGALTSALNKAWSDHDSGQLTVEDIKSLTEDLYKMKYAGPELKNAMVVVEEAGRQAAQHREVHVKHGQTFVGKDRQKCNVLQLLFRDDSLEDISTK